MACSFAGGRRQGALEEESEEIVERRTGLTSKQSSRALCRVRWAAALWLADAVVGCKVEKCIRQSGPAVPQVVWVLQC